MRDPVGTTKYLNKVEAWEQRKVTYSASRGLLNVHPIIWI